MNHNILISSTPAPGFKLVIRNRRDNNVEIYTRPDLEGEFAAGGASIGRWVIGVVVVLMVLRFLAGSPSEENVANNPEVPQTEMAAVPR